MTRGFGKKVEKTMRLTEAEEAAKKFHVLQWY